MTNQKKRGAKKYIVAAIAALLALAALAALYFYLSQMGYLGVFKSIEALQTFVSGFGVWAPLVFMFLQFLQVILAPIPGNVTTLAGGAMFGFWPALIYSSIAILIGSMAAFGIGKFFGRRLVGKLVPIEIVEKYVAVLAKKQRLTLALIFLLPFFPDDILCFVAGMLGYSWIFFGCIIAVTRPWGLIFSALIGSGTISIPLWGWGLLAVVVAALLFFSVRYGSRAEDWLLSRLRRKEKHSVDFTDERP